MTCRQDCDGLKITNERKRQYNRSSQQVAANEDSNPRQVDTRRFILVMLQGAAGVQFNTTGAFAA